MYAYNFKPKRDGINHREIFVVMPFEKEFDFIYNELIVPATKTANEKLGFNEDLSLCPYRTKDDIRTTSGWINVLEHLISAKIVLGVLTSNNPNVFYELGIAHATQPITRQILIAEKGYETKFDTKDLIYYEYDPSTLSKCVIPLGERISDAVKQYKIEDEKKIRKARMFIGLFDFEVIMQYGERSHFAIRSQDRTGYDLANGEGSFDRCVEGIKNLCLSGLLGLNTLSKREGNRVVVEFSYYWTSLGNDVLHLMKIIGQEELKLRRSKLPDFFER